MGRIIDPNSKIVVVDGKEMIVQRDYVISTNRTVEEIDKEIEKAKKISDELTDWPIA